MNNLEVSRKTRVGAWIINSLPTFAIHMISGLVLMTANNSSSAKAVATGSLISSIWLAYCAYLVISKHQSFGGKMLGYKWVNAKDGSDDIKIVKLFLVTFGYGILTFITLGILPIIDVITLSKRNGTYWENWANVKKTFIK